MQKWWKTLSTKQQKEEYKKDKNLVFYVTIPKSWK
jgi:hypothetical protein